ncbi:MAG: hydrogenase maturation protease [Fidelibacterota bacterium]
MKYHKNSNLNPKVLILGIGNLLLSDEGLGVHTIHLLQDRYEFPDNVTLCDGGTGGLSLLSEIKDKDYLYIIDALLVGEDPGTIVQFTYDAIPDNYVKKDTAHGIDLLDILISAQLIDELPPTTILGMQPADISTPSLEMTLTISSNLDSLIGVLLNQLTKIGIKVEKKS